jgi:hypothetical protein
MDGSAGMRWPAKVGQLFNVVGSTDVLALCTDRPQPHERLLTRARGSGKMAWWHPRGHGLIPYCAEQFFQMPIEAFQKEFRRLSAAGAGRAIPFDSNPTWQGSGQAWSNAKVLLSG